MPPSRLIPQVDIFAGPGGLCEGFAAYRDRGQRVMSPVLSIEMDAVAHRTLQLRAFYRKFPDGNAPQDYYDYLAGKLTLDELYARHELQAEHAKRDRGRERGSG